jgi:ATP-binding cassette, subfamily B, multidrug efflux pump
VLTKFLLVSFRPYRRSIAVLSVLQLIHILGTLLLPALNANIVNKGIVTGDMDYVVQLGIIMVVVTILQILCAIGAVYLSAHVAAAVGRDLRAMMFRRIQDFSERDVTQFGSSSLVTRTINDVDQVQLLAVSIFRVALPAPMMAGGAVILALTLDVPLSMLLVGVMVVVLVISAAILGRMAPLYGRMQGYLDRVNQLLREQVTGVQVIRAFVNVDRERARFGRENSAMRDVAERVGTLISTIPAAIVLTTNIFGVLLIWIGTGRIDSGNLGPGDLMALLGYLGLCVMAVSIAIIMLGTIPRAKVSAIRIREVLDTATSVPAPSKAATDAATTGNLEMRSVTFCYPGSTEPVLDSIDLTASPGETVGILGSTGSGKTTLLNLVMRMFDATGGAVLVNDIDVRLMDVDVLPRTIALVPQRPYLFSGTVENNLRFGRLESRHSELWHALEVAQARKFVENLPDGLRTPIGQGGSELSGGQRQRLAIARALLCNAPIYLLDDCFSDLDFATAAAVQNALTAELSTATVLMVAQRAHTVRSADRVIVLDAGRIVATGTPDELSRNNEFYQEIVRSELTALGTI